MPRHPLLLVLLLVGLALVGCTDHPAAVSSAGPPEVPAALADVEGIDGATALVDDRGRGPGTFAVPGAGRSSTLVATITCTSPDTPARLRFVLASGQDWGLLSSAGCGGAVEETAPLDPGDPPTMLQVTVPDGSRYAVVVHGKGATGRVG